MNWRGRRCEPQYRSVGWKSSAIATRRLSDPRFARYAWDVAFYAATVLRRRHATRLGALLANRLSAGVLNVPLLEAAAGRKTLPSYSGLAGATLIAGRLSRQFDVDQPNFRTLPARIRSELAPLAFKGESMRYFP